MEKHKHRPFWFCDSQSQAYLIKSYNLALVELAHSHRGRTVVERVTAGVKTWLTINQPYKCSIVHSCTTNVAGEPLNQFCSWCNCLMLPLHIVWRVESRVTSKPCTGLYYYISIKARRVMTFLQWHFLQGQSHVRATQAVQLATHTPLITLNTHGKRLYATLTLVAYTLLLYSLPHVDRWSGSIFTEVEERWEMGTKRIQCSSRSIARPSLTWWHSSR